MAPAEPHSPAAFATMALQLAYNGALSSFFVNSDAPAVVTRIANYLQKASPSRVYTMPAFMFPLRDDAKRGDEIGLRAWKLQQRLAHAETPESWRAVGAAPDEGAAILAQLLIGVECASYIAILSSSLGKVASLLRVGRLDRVVDMDGVGWYSCSPSESAARGGPARQPATFGVWNAGNYSKMMRARPCKWTRENSCSNRL